MEHVVICVCSANSHRSYTGTQKKVKVNGAIEMSGNEDNGIETEENIGQADNSGEPAMATESSRK